jgi:hypothetical protein
MIASCVFALAPGVLLSAPSQAQIMGGFTQAGSFSNQSGAFGIPFNRSFGNFAGTNQFGFNGFGGFNEGFAGGWNGGFGGLGVPAWGAVSGGSFVGGGWNNGFNGFNNGFGGFGNGFNNGFGGGFNNGFGGFSNAGLNPYNYGPGLGANAIGGYPVAQGGYYVPGFGVLGGTSLAQPVYGGTYVPGFGVVGGGFAGPGTAVPFNPGGFGTSGFGAGAAGFGGGGLGSPTANGGTMIPGFGVVGGR